MFEVKSVKKLNIKKRWTENKSYKSLATVVGKKSENDFVELNLHEKVHGPHGLLAGTTGSGKSEVIQTYILSLALNYSPYEVGFLLIDYKGGGMANLFEGMPHHLGSITNLDGYQSMRALASIKSELKRRQQIFSDYKVNHINDYHKMFEKNEVEEPLPHLFLISDEFAELKSEQPDFMKELVSAARIGRSLGIHLILATQKPTGVVDEQIWSNSKFKLCLKVAEESDSKELLKTPDAAYITHPGRGYLKVGTNELYELFQSGYSGAAYGEVDEDNRDMRIYSIDKYGHHNLINEEAEPDEEVNLEEISELTAVLEEISYVYENMKMVEIPRPWLPPLEDIMFSEIIVEDKSSYIIDLGLIDLPHKQSQIKYALDFAKTQNVLIAGAKISGKTTALLNIALRLAAQNSPQLLEYIVFDFGNAGLLPLKKLNHTSEYIKIHDEEMHVRFIKLINEIINERKAMFEKLSVTNFSMYNKKSRTMMSNLIIILDNYEALKDLEPGLIEVFEYVSREGNNLGIQMIVTSTKAVNIKPKVLDSFITRIMLYPVDKNDVTNTLGKTKYEIPELPGRCFILHEVPEVAHLFDCTTETDDLIRIDNINTIVLDINGTYSHSNSRIKTMPKLVEPYKFEMRNGFFYTGISYEKVEPNYIEMDNIFITGGLKSGKTNILRILITQLSDNAKILLIDDFKKELSEFALKYDYISTAGDISSLEESTVEYDYIIINKMTLIDELDRKKIQPCHNWLVNQFRNDTKFIVELEDMPKGSGKFNILLKKFQTYILTDLNFTMRYSGLPSKNLKKEIWSIEDSCVMQNGFYSKFMIELVEEKKVDLVDIKMSKMTANEFAFNREIYQLRNMYVSGIYKLSVIDMFVNRFKERIVMIDDIYNEYNDATVKFVKFADYFVEDASKKILIINTVSQLKAYPNKERAEIYDRIYDDVKKGMKLILAIDEKILGQSEFSKYLKNIGFGIVSMDISEFKMMKLKNSAFKKKKHEEGTIYIISEGEVSVQKYEV